jgi:hypothetical protein
MKYFKVFPKQIKNCCNREIIETGFTHFFFSKSTNSMIKSILKLKAYAAKLILVLSAIPEPKANPNKSNMAINGNITNKSLRSELK